MRTEMRRLPFRNSNMRNTASTTIGENNSIEEENKNYFSGNFNNKKRSKENEDEGLMINKGEEKRNFSRGEVNSIPYQMRLGYLRTGT